MTAAYSIGKLGDVSGIHFGWEWLKDCFNTGVSGEEGGFVGMLTAFVLVKIIGKGGAYIVTIACMLISIIITMNKPFSFIYDSIVEFRKERKEYKEEKMAVEEDICHDEYDENSVSEYQLDIDTYKELEKVPEGEKKRVNIGKKKTILGYLKADEDTLFKNKDDVQDVKLDKQPEAQEPVLDADMPEAEEVSYGLGGADSIYIVSKGGKEKRAVTDLDGVNSLEFKSPFKEEEPAPMPAEFGEEPAAAAEAVKDGADVAAGAAAGMAGAAAGAAVKDVPPKKEKMDDSELEKGIEKMNRELNAQSAGNKDGEQLEMPEVKYELPPISLLRGGVSESRGDETAELSRKASRLERTLQSFNVNAKVINVSRGPSVTRFEVQPAVGVKVSSIVRLQDDIALNMEAKSIRLEAPIPGKAAVGIEIENDDKKPVFLREIIGSKEFSDSKSKITFAVGRDISGNPVIADLGDMPHMLIAGSTGSGKSVCINSIILSLLYKARPDEVKIIMVDPKVVELSHYNGIPHLMIPVVNEASKAAVALNWAVKEMEDRYARFSEIGVKDLAGFNKKAADREDLQPMPQIVIIIDELADLMMTAPQQVEDAICRLAQMARAAGMHLIIATQRPSVDVITGVIKNNVPSRIAFAVSSQVDSRTILNSSGAEKLVGKGDMLFAPIGLGKPLRVQGNFVSEEEIAAVIDFVSNQDQKQEFSNDLMDTIETSSIDYDEEGVDELLRDAIELVVNAEQASVSMLQRKFRIGYNRAGRLVDMMEERGIVGPADGSRPRRVLLSKAGLEELDNRGEHSFKTEERMVSEDAVSDYEGETQYVSDEYNIDSKAPDYEPDPEPEDI
ncbi:MAG: DNA translocase FtsK [Firmicutes bacterium]|nr:DNA translocase FtsK [Bacillota bacterium]